jgi:hypothetical protein
MGQLNQSDPPSRKLLGSSSSHDMRKQSSNLTTGVVWDYQGWNDGFLDFALGRWMRREAPAFEI